jgi:hypothetical protein
MRTEVMTRNKSAVCRIANRISRDVSRHDAFAQAWAIVKAGGLEVAVRGVSFGTRQEALLKIAEWLKTGIPTGRARKPRMILFLLRTRTRIKCHAFYSNCLCNREIT